MPNPPRPATASAPEVKQVPASEAAPAPAIKLEPERDPHPAWCTQRRTKKRFLDEGESLSKSNRVVTPDDQTYNNEDVYDAEYIGLIPELQDDGGESWVTSNAQGGKSGCQN